MEERTAIITLRIAPSEKKAFERIAAERDDTTSQMLRRYINHAITQHAARTAQGSLELETSNTPQPAAKKPAKGQKMAAACAKNMRRP